MAGEAGPDAQRRRLQRLVRWSRNGHTRPFLLSQEIASTKPERSMPTSPKYQVNTAEGCWLTVKIPQSYPQLIQTHFALAASAAETNRTAISMCFAIPPNDLSSAARTERQGKQPTGNRVRCSDLLGARAYSNAERRQPAKTTPRHHPGEALQRSRGRTQAA